MKTPFLLVLVVLTIGLPLALVGTPAAEAGWCGGGRSGQSGRSPASLAELQIHWEVVQYLTPPEAVVTGAPAEAKADAPEVEVPSPFAAMRRPVVVWVYGAASADDDTLQKLEDVVFKDEKLSLAMKAFRAVRISPEDVEKDPLLKEEGKSLPRILVIDPAKEDIKVIEARSLKASKIYSELKRAAKHSLDINLDRLVKQHLKLLGEQDKLAGEMKVLRDKESREAEKGDERDLAEVREEIEALEKELQKLAEEQRLLWKIEAEEKAAA